MADAISQMMNDMEQEENIAGVRSTVAVSEAALGQARLMTSVASNIKHDLSCDRHPMADDHPRAAYGPCAWTGQELLEFYHKDLLSKMGVSAGLDHLEDARQTVSGWEMDPRHLPQRVAALGMLLADELDPHTARMGMGEALLYLFDFEARCEVLETGREARKTVLLALATDALLTILPYEQDSLMAEIMLTDGDRLFIWWNVDGSTESRIESRPVGQVLWQDGGPTLDLDWSVSGRLVGPNNLERTVEVGF